MASTDAGKREVVEFIFNHFSDGSTVLDVGACDGKWRDLLGNRYVMDACEIYLPNIEVNNLRGKYREVFAKDIMDLEYTWYDLIIFGDVLEHMSVFKAQRVLEYARSRCKDMIIGVPYLYPQAALYGNPHEVHLQPDLTEQVFRERYPGYELLWSQGNYAYWHSSPCAGL